MDLDILKIVNGVIYTNRYMYKCNEPPFNTHIFEGGSVHPYNVLGGRGEFPEGHLCLCGEKAYKSEVVKEKPFIHPEPEKCNQHKKCL